MDDHSDINGRHQRLQWFNEVLYDQMPRVYNAVDYLTFGVWWRLVRRALEYVPEGQRVLEVGFGPGRLQVALAKRSLLAVGIDLAGGMCHFTRQRLVRSQLPANITRGSVFEMPYPTAAFDTVVSTFAFSGFPDGLDAMQEMTRVVAPGGRLVLVDIALPDDGNWLGTALARLWESMGDFLYDMPGMMQAEGLRVTVCEEFGPGNHIRAVVGQKVVTG